LQRFSKPVSFSKMVILRLTSILLALWVQPAAAGIRPLRVKHIGLA